MAEIVACRICPRRPGVGKQQTKDCESLFIGISPPPGTPRAALTLRKYHYHRYSVIAAPR